MELDDGKRIFTKSFCSHFAGENPSFVWRNCNTKASHFPRVEFTFTFGKFNFLESEEKRVPCAAYKCCVHAKKIKIVQLVTPFPNWLTLTYDEITMCLCRFQNFTAFHDSLSLTPWVSGSVVIAAGVRTRLRRVFSASKKWDESDLDLLLFFSFVLTPPTQIERNLSSFHQQQRRRNVGFPYSRRHRRRRSKWVTSHSFAFKNKRVANCCCVCWLGERRIDTVSQITIRTLFNLQNCCRGFCKRKKMEKIDYHARRRRCCISNDETVSTSDNIYPKCLDCSFIDSKKWL